MNIRVGEERITEKEEGMVQMEKGGWDVLGGSGRKRELCGEV